MASSERALPTEIGRYRIVRVLGQGAMGLVLLAHDPVLDRDVALKLLRGDLGLPPDQLRALVERMRQEARASARVSHPNIVALHDMGEDPAQGLYLVFEYVEGVTLQDRLERGPLGPAAAARLAREVGDALGTAHARGVLHRDIKPENLILAPAGAKIADFGIARVPNSTLTKSGKLLGTPAYSAPEAIASGTFSAESDQFSMAATLWEALAGRRAFPGDDTMTVAARIANDMPPPIAKACGLDAHVDAVLARALSKNPRERFASCDQFGHALSEALDVAPRTVMPTLPDEHHRQAVRQMKARPRIVLISALVGAALAVLGFQLMGRLHAADEAAPPTVGSIDADADASAQAAATIAATQPRPGRHHHHAHRRQPAPRTSHDQTTRGDAASRDGARRHPQSSSSPRLGATSKKNSLQRRDNRARGRGSP